MTARTIARHGYNAGLRAAEPVIAPRRPPRVTVLLGTVRSGTTALMEAMSAGSGAPAIFEPLRPTVLRAVDRVVPRHGYARLTPGANDPDMRRLVGEIFRGRHLSRWSTRQLDLRKLRAADQLLVKEVRASRMAGWLEEQFPDVRFQFIVRHPLAAVASMHRGHWATLPWEAVVPPAADTLGILPERLAPRGSPTSRWLMGLWLADNVTAVRELSETAMASVVHYEDLVLDPRSQVERLAASLDHFDTGRAVASLERPSRHASPDFGRRRDLPFSSSERSDLAAMLRDFEVDYYVLSESAPVYRLGVRG